MAGEVAVFLDHMEEDKWWSQGGLLQSDEVYKEDLQRYKNARVQEEVRGTNGVTVVGLKDGGLKFAKDRGLKNTFNGYIEKSEVWGGSPPNLHSNYTP